MATCSVRRCPALGRFIIRHFRRCPTGIPPRRRIARCPRTRRFRSTRQSVARFITEKLKGKQMSSSSPSPTTLRFLGPKGNAATLMFNGRAYSVAAASTIDVPNMDAQVCATNGWVQIGGGSGTTAQRPANPYVGQLYVDTVIRPMIRSASLSGMRV
jgi:hypothetical protein